MNEKIKAKKIVAIIPARGGSQRLKRKNIFPLWGKPLIYWAIDACHKSHYIDEVWVSSEDEEIIDISEEFKALIHRREPKLANAAVYKMKAVRSAAMHIEKIATRPIDIFISLQANSPEITSDILDRAIETFEHYERDELISVDLNLMQNAAFRILRGNNVYQTELSTKCGVFMCELTDVHTKQDIDFLEAKIKM